MTLTQKPKEVHGLKRTLVIITCLIFGAGTCGTALALRMRVDQPASTGGPAPAAGQGAPLKVKPGIMAGNIESQVRPVYPPDAKKRKIQGSVVLHAIIGKDGKVDTLAIISGPKELQKSAIDAVSKWVYRPYLLNGNPTEVETTITVTYSLG
jgi:TonB family protein